MENRISALAAVAVFVRRTAQRRTPVNTILCAGSALAGRRIERLALRRATFCRRTWMSHARTVVAVRQDRHTVAVSRRIVRMDITTGLFVDLLVRLILRCEEQFVFISFIS